MAMLISTLATCFKLMWFVLPKHTSRTVAAFSEQVVSLWEEFVEFVKPPVKASGRVLSSRDPLNGVGWGRMKEETMPYCIITDLCDLDNLLCICLALVTSSS